LAADPNTVQQEDWIYLATHGWFRDDVPTPSGLVTPGTVSKTSWQFSLGLLAKEPGYKTIEDSAVSLSFMPKATTLLAVGTQPTLFTLGILAPLLHWLVASRTPPSVNSFFMYLG
jgi:hypothetical protein